MLFRGAAAPVRREVTPDGSAWPAFSDRPSEKPRELLFKASLDWLRSGTVNGVTAITVATPARGSGLVDVCVTTPVGH